MKGTVPSWNLVFNTEIGISFGESFHKIPISKKEIRKEQTKVKLTQQQEQYGFKLWYQFIYGISENPQNNHCTQGMHFIG